MILSHSPAVQSPLHKEWPCNAEKTTETFFMLQERAMSIFYNCPEHLRTFEDNFISTCPALIAACWFVHVNTTFMVEMVLGRQLLGFTVLYLVLFQFCSTDPG